MTVKDYLSNISSDEITDRLRYLDSIIKELHEYVFYDNNRQYHNGCYFVDNIEQIEIINGQVVLASFKDKIDYLDSGIKNKGNKWDIIELCCIGICAYNHFNHFSSSKEFMKNIIESFNRIVLNDRVPKYMQEYYIEVFKKVKKCFDTNDEECLNDIGYLNEFLDRYYSDELSSGESRGNSKVKATPYGKLFNNDKENAYVNVLIIPSIMVLVYLLILIVYYMFLR